MKKLAPLLCLPLLASCGTMVNGTTQPMCITSTPSDANVFVDSCYIGKTPCRARLCRRSDHIVTVCLDGHDPYIIQVDRHMSGWVFGNIVFGGVIGVAVDAVSGGLYKLDASQTHACFNAPQLAKLQTEDGMQIAIVEKAQPDWEQIGTITDSEYVTL